MPAVLEVRPPAAQRRPPYLGGAEYELRLLDRDGRIVRVFRSRQPGDDAARAIILSIRNVDYSRYELWRGMTKIDGGPAFVIC